MCSLPPSSSHTHNHPASWVVGAPLFLTQPLSHHQHCPAFTTPSIGLLLPPPQTPFHFNSHKKSNTETKKGRGLIVVMGFVYPMHLPTHQPLAPASPSLHPYTPPTTAVQFLLKTWPLPWFSSPWAFQALHNLHVMSVAHALWGALPGSLLPAIHCTVWHLALPMAEAICVPFGRLGAFRWLVVGGNHR